MFSVFGEQQLPTVKLNAPPAEMVNWKNEERVKLCYDKLFKPMSESGKKKLIIMNKIGGSD